MVGSLFLHTERERQRERERERERERGASVNFLAVPVLSCTLLGLTNLTYENVFVGLHTKCT